MTSVSDVHPSTSTAVRIEPLLQTLRDLQCPISHLTPGQHVPLSADAAIDVFWPPPAALLFKPSRRSW